MRTFVKYNRDGVILSVCKVEAMPEEVDTPFGPLPEGEAVFEAPAGGDFDRMEAIDIHGQYRVDLRRKRLVKKT